MGSDILYSTVSYYTLLLLMIIFYFYLLFISLSKVPKKIKSYVSFFIILALIKNIYILILALSKSGFSIVLSKGFILLDIIYIPAILLTLFYVFWRSDKLKYAKLIRIISVFVLLYAICIISFGARFDINQVFGYFLVYDKNIIFRVFIAIFYTLILIFMIYCRFNKSTNSKGMSIIIVCIVAIIVDNLCIVALNSYLPYSIISEGLTVCAMCYGFRTFK